MNPRKKPPERQPTTPIIPLLLGGIILLAVGAFGGYLIANSKTTNITTIPVIPTPSDAPDTTRPTSMPKPTTVAKEAELSSMTGWKKMPMDIFMISLPPEATMEEHEGCTDDVHTKFDTCFLIQNHDPNLLAPPHITIKMKTYQGGSRRVEAGLGDLANYRFTEKLFGVHAGLESEFICKISECTSLRQIILVVGDKLIVVTDGMYKKDDTTTLESPITNTIISSIVK